MKKKKPKKDLKKELFQKLIEESMTRKVVTVKGDASLQEVSKAMATRNISCVVIVSDKNPRKPTGIITERDLVKKVLSKPITEKRINSIKAKNMMTSPVKCIHPKELLVPIAKLMRNNKSRRFPVIDDTGNMVGLVTETDVLDGMIQLVKHLNWNLVDKLMTMKAALEQYVEELKEHNII